MTAATAVLALAGGACGTLPGAPSRPVAAGHLAAVHDPGQVTWLQLPAACHARAGGRLPDPACTPGSVDPGVTQSSIGSTICRRGYTSSVRPPASQTATVKRAMYRLYRIPRGIPAELDHLVPDRDRGKQRGYQLVFHMSAVCPTRKTWLKTRCGTRYAPAW